MENSLPAIPAKRYFTIGEVSALCAVKPYVLRYWEQEFSQLRPMKRRGNRRYYQHHEVLLIRRIRDLLYDQGFTISGARSQLGVGAHLDSGLTSPLLNSLGGPVGIGDQPESPVQPERPSHAVTTPLAASELRSELLSLRDLLIGPHER